MPNRVQKGGGGSPPKARDPAELQQLLDAFTGSYDWFRHSTGYLYTNGVQFLAEKAGAYWLLDLIFSRQKAARRDPKLRRFQVWTLKKLPNHSALLTCSRDTDDPAFTVRIPFTDFLFDSFTLYFEEGTLMLPSEH